MQLAGAGAELISDVYLCCSSFTLSSAVTVDALGYWDDGLGNDHDVGIWTIGGTLLVSTTVLGIDPLFDNFRYGSIADFVLGPGTYVIGGEFLGNGDPFPAFATGITTIPQYTYGEDRQIFGGGLNFPTQTFGIYGDNGILLANFSIAAIPEPASWALMIAGFGLVGFAVRRRPVAVAA